MNNFKLPALTLGILLAAGNAGAEHSVDQSGVTFSPMIGQYNFDSNRDVEDDFLYSFGLGYQFNSPWAVELVYLGARTEPDRSNTHVDLDQIRLDGLYHFPREGNFQTYLAAGIGESEYTRRFSDAVETNINAGGGVRYFLSPKLSLRGDVRLIGSFDEEDTDLALSFGLHMHSVGNPLRMHLWRAHRWPLLRPRLIPTAMVFPILGISARILSAAQRLTKWVVTS